MNGELFTKINDKVINIKFINLYLLLFIIIYNF